MTNEQQDLPQVDSRRVMAASAQGGTGSCGQAQVSSDRITDTHSRGYAKRAVRYWLAITPCGNFGVTVTYSDRHKRPGGEGRAVACAEHVGRRSGIIELEVASDVTKAATKRENNVRLR